ncbi:MAG: DNA primase [Methyloligellaceae bacterium]
MRFDPSFLDEIRARLPVSQVVARRVKLKRQGREFVGLSPFKQEKTPSFTVNDKKGFYHCFASGEHGDVFTFLMKTEGASFPEAVERLAQEAGLPMPERRPGDAEREAKRATLHEVLEKATCYFEARLQAREGADALRYLRDRGVEDATRRAFRLGFAPPGRYELKQFLASEGVTPEQMAEAGLVISGDDIAVSYDRFRNRIMFPISDLKGRVIAFGGRALDADARAKYMNSPETQLFHKGSVLFNGAGAREAAYADGGVIVVEGYMDVIALTGAGFANAVAPLGTALTTDQLKLLWRMAPEPVLCFDGDAAGTKAAHRALEAALPLLTPGHSLRFAFLPLEQDPDDLVRNEGAEAFRGVLANARPLADVLWAREVESGSWDTPERRAALEARLETLLGEIGDAKVRRHYERDISDRLGSFWSTFRRQTGPARGHARTGHGFAGRDRRSREPWRGSGPAAGAGGDRQFAGSSAASESLKRSGLVRGVSAQFLEREALLVLTPLNHPWFLDAFSEEFAGLEFQNRKIARLRDAMIALQTRQNTLDSEAFRTQLSQQGLGAIVAQVERAVTHKSNWSAQPHASRDDVVTGWRQMSALHHKSLELERELEAAERAFQAEGTDESFARLRDIRLQLLNAEGTEASVEGYGAGTECPGAVSP